MSIHSKSGGSWRDIFEPSIRRAGSWEDAGSSTDGVCAVYVRVSGAWRIVWPLKHTVSAVSASAVQASSCSASITIQEDGRIKESGTGISTTYEDFAENGGDTDKDGNAPVLFQYKWTGTACDTVPATINTWTDLSGDQVFTNNDNGEGGGPNSSSFTIEIRAKDVGTASKISISATCSAEYIGI